MAGPVLSIGINPAKAKTGAGVVKNELDGIKSKAMKTEAVVNGLGTKAGMAMNKAATGTKAFGASLNAARLAAVAFGVAIFASVAGLLRVASSYQDINTSLQAVTGSAEGAVDAFELINSVVGKTPFTVNALAESFIKLKAAGIEPTVDQMMLFSDVASLTTDRMGTLQAITDLYARTTAGGLGLEDLNRLADRGVPVFKIFSDKLGLSRLEISKVGQSAEGAALLLETLEIGLKDVAGGASELAGKNLSVAFSNFMDAVRGTIDVVLNFSGATGGLGGVIQGAAMSIQDFSANLRSFMTDVSGAWESNLLFKASVLGVAGAITTMLVPSIVALGTAFVTLALSNPFTAIALGAVAAAVMIIKNWDVLKAWFEFQLPAMMARGKSDWSAFASDVLVTINSLATGMVESMTVAFNAAFIDPLNKVIGFARDHPAIATLIFGPAGFAASKIAEFDQITSSFEGFVSVQGAAEQALANSNNEFERSLGLSAQYTAAIEAINGSKAEGVALTEEEVRTNEELRKALAELDAAGGAGKAAAKSQSAFDSLRASLDDTFASELEFARGQEVITEALARGIVNTKTAAGVLELLREKYELATDAGKQMQAALADTFANSIGKGLTDIVEGTKTVAEAFKSMAVDIIKELYQVLVVQQLVAGIKSFLGFSDGGAFSGGEVLANANGNAFSGGNVVPFANGGVVNSPTLFPMQSGIGLMGEAGPEAIMPLSRGRNGKLGVRSEGGGSQTVVNQTINVTAGVAQTVRAEMLGLLPQLKEQTIQAVTDENRRSARA